MMFASDFAMQTGRKYQRSEPDLLSLCRTTTTRMRNASTAARRYARVALFTMLDRYVLYEGERAWCMSMWCRGADGRLQGYACGLALYALAG
jgi:hypothetical protein